MDGSRSTENGTGRIAARIDRLPLTWMQWRIALASQLFWGVIIAADGVPARLYPFVWGPQGAFGTAAFSVLLAVQFGVGILIGEYLVGMAADRWGRRTALMLSTLLLALTMWPAAFTDNFYLLLLFFGISATGMGGVLACNVVYMGEFVSPRHRGSVMLTSQILAVLVFGLLSYVPAILWIPSNPALYICFYCAVALVVLVPVAIWVMPESPRWLEAHGRHAKAEQVMAALEAESLRRSGMSQLPEPDYARYAVPVTAHVPLRELLVGEYGRRTIVLLIVWVLGYSGIIYGFYGFMPVILRNFGLDADKTFAVILVASVFGGAAGLGLCAAMGEAVERRAIILGAAIVNAAALATFFFLHGLIASFVLMSVVIGAETAWLFSMYNYTAASYPTRLRATGTGVTDGFGHLGSIFGPIVAGALFTATAAQGHIGWFAYIIIPGGLLPSILVAWRGINQRGAILEQISG